MSKHERLDLLVIARGLLASRQAARTAIMDGAVLVNGEKITKPGQNIDLSAKIELIPSFKPARFVSRGGLKLEKAIKEFSIAVDNRICLDIGASTGGFTDCLLQHGAKQVYAVDVGYGQLDWQLRNNERVIVKERQNIRYLTKQSLYDSAVEIATLATIDVSFISLKQVVPVCYQLLNQEEAEIICLIKPQFEAGRTLVGKGGVVSSLDTHKTVINQVIEAADTLKLATLGLTYSPLVGPAGNLEFLLYLKANVGAANISVQAVVEKAHANLLQQKI